MNPDLAACLYALTLAASALLWLARHCGWAGGL